MRKLLLITLLALGLLLSACGAPSEPGVTPAAGKLTFLFFYTDG